MAYNCIVWEKASIKYHSWLVGFYKYPKFHQSISYSHQISPNVNIFHILFHLCEEIVSYRIVSYRIVALNAFNFAYMLLLMTVQMSILE